MKLRYFSTQHDTTGDAPSLATDGQAVYACMGIAAVFSAPEGETFDGTGTFEAYVYMPVEVTNGAPSDWRWMRHEALDVAPSNGERDVPSGDFQSFTGGASRALWVPNGVGLSGGTTIDVVQIAREY